MNARGRGTQHLAMWHKSTYSGAGNQCVEVAGTPSGVVLRDSRNPEGVRLAVSRRAWAALVAGIRTGQRR
jgi:hypothetical protein